MKDLDFTAIQMFPSEPGILFSNKCVLTHTKIISPLHLSLNRREHSILNENVNDQKEEYVFFSTA